MWHVKWFHYYQYDILWMLSSCNICFKFRISWTRLTLTKVGGGWDTACVLLRQKRRCQVNNEYSRNDSHWNGFYLMLQAAELHAHVRLQGADQECFGGQATVISVFRSIGTSEKMPKRNFPFMNTACNSAFGEQDLRITRDAFVNTCWSQKIDPCSK